jgi:hypothetical protein
MRTVGCTGWQSARSLPAPISLSGEPRSGDTSRVGSITNVTSAGVAASTSQGTLLIR